MKKVSVLPKLDKNKWDKINSNGVSVGKYNPLNWVVMDNILIQAKHNLTNIEQKLWEYLISLIDLKKPSIKLKIKKIDIIYFLFSETRNKKSTEINSWYYNRLRSAFEKLSNSGIIIKFDNRKGEMGIPCCAFFDHEDINYILVEFTHMIFPFLCYLKGNFTKYSIGYINKLKGKYSVCLYKYFSMKVNIRENNKKISWQEDLNDLKFTLDMEKKYKLFNNFKRRILDSSIKEINKHTDLEIDYKTVCGGPNERKVLAIEFTAKKKYKETAIEKSKNKVQFSKEIFSNKQNSIKEEKAIPAAIYTVENANTHKTVKEVEVSKITNTKPTRKTTINNIDFQKTEKEKVPEKKTPFFKKVKKCFSFYKSM